MIRFALKLWAFLQILGFVLAVIFLGFLAAMLTKGGR